MGHIYRWSYSHWLFRREHIWRLVLGMSAGRYVGVWWRNIDCLDIELRSILSDGRGTPGKCYSRLFKPVYNVSSGGPREACHSLLPNLSGFDVMSIDLIRVFRMMLWLCAELGSWIIFFSFSLFTVLASFTRYIPTTWSFPNWIDLLRVLKFTSTYS
jgi:hypothetical protein